ncbi:MAG: serine/threonine protein phosphatase [Methylobacterium sp.]|uniref:metallophosphoesterase family protein n=1 Tax=Methylobacterium sp. TaxID=409 RepID=UPI00258FD336|nr:metallophosphoesterase family protein [Methylobacterium sp.]MBY0299223.1 serine/threonine protein phosphatase [Methylobacterium sp.]
MDAWRRRPDDGLVYWPALGGRSLAVFGDIHGRDDLLAAAQARLDAVAGARGLRPLEIYLGDYVDRGPDSPAVLDRLIARGRERETVCLRGNHEAMLLGALDDPAVLRSWLGWGGDATLRAYGCPLPRDQEPAAADLAVLQQHLRRALPAHHRAFLAGLPVAYTIGALLLVHAGIRPGRLIERQDEADLLWIREPFLSSTRDHGLLVVHGHTPVAAPDFRFNRINLDTGAVYTGVLTCLLISDRSIEVL